MPQKIEIYKPEPTEAARYFTLRRTLFTEELTQSGLVSDRVDLVREWPERKHWLGLEAFLDSPITYYVRGVRDEKGPAGYLVAEYQWPENPDSKYVAYLGLHARVRGQGIATQLLTEFEAIDPERDTTLHVFDKNQPAVNFYAKQGYRVIAQDDPWSIEGQPLDLNIMRREGVTA